jgi:Amt family ammonium transporter
MPGYGAVLVGLLAGVIAPWVLMLLELRLRLDDVAGASATHLIGGTVGWLAAPLLAATAADRQTDSFVGHLLMLLLAVVVSAAVTGVTLLIFRAFSGLRVSESAEFDGTDLAELDVNAYPDFQQTMIKSYHLREL